MASVGTRGAIHHVVEETGYKFDPLQPTNRKERRVAESRARQKKVKHVHPDHGYSVEPYNLPRNYN